MQATKDAAWRASRTCTKREHSFWIHQLLKSRGSNVGFTTESGQACHPAAAAWHYSRTSSPNCKCRRPVGQLQCICRGPGPPVKPSIAPSVQAPVARTPVVCQAAAAEIVEAESSTSSKEGVAHLRFSRGSAFKVGVCGCCQPAAVACCRGHQARAAAGVVSEAVYGPQ